MNPDTAPPSAPNSPATAVSPSPAEPSAVAQPSAAARPDWGVWWGRAVQLALVLALLSSLLLWQKLRDIQGQLARQSADASTVASEARAMAKQAQELSHETAAKLAVADARISEVALQRSQLEELMQSLTRSRDENLVVDIESALRLAQQQAQLTGSIEPLLAALKTAETRLARAAQPRLLPVQRAVAKDLARVKAATVSDLPNLLVKLDELVRLADELTLANAVGLPLESPPANAPDPRVQRWWDAAWQRVTQEASKLVRVSSLPSADAALLSPEQAFFVRENFKLKLLNARLGLLARQHDAARADLASAAQTLARYFAPDSRKTQVAAGLLQHTQTQMKTLQLPAIDDTLTALTTAVAGR